MTDVAPRKKKKIIRIRKIDKSKNTQATEDATSWKVAPSQTTSITVSTLQPGTITSNRILSGGISMGTTTPAPNYARVEIQPDGEVRQYNASGQTYTIISPVREKITPKKPRTAEVLDFDQEELDKKSHWTTAEAAWFCGMSRTTWHVRMHKMSTEKKRPIYPTKLGEGRGKQNLYLADDVRKYKELIGRT
jgi:hypothetical protein